GHFENASAERRRISPAREIDDLLVDRSNYFPQLENVAEQLRQEIELEGPFVVRTLSDVLERRHGIRIVVGGDPPAGQADYPGQYRYFPEISTMWLHGATTLATRQFQLARL